MDALIEFKHLFANPNALLALFALMMAFATLWAYRSIWIWGGFVAISLVLAHLAHFIQPIALASIGGLGLVHWILKHNVKGFGRFILVIIATVLSIGLCFHLMPGFKNWEIASGLRLGPGAYPYSLWGNFDKPFVGLFVLAFAIPLIGSKKELKHVAKKTIPFTIVGIALITFLAFYFGQVKYAPKFPSISLVWILINLLLVTTAEEGFLRGFIQREFYKWFGEGSQASVGAVVITALLFAALHIKLVSSMPYLALVFVAGLVYGGIYQYTKAIESSIFCHFCLNAVHFFFFTYPVLIG